MVTKTQKHIIEYLLSNPEESHTIRGISKKLGKSYTLVYNNISDLEKKGIISKQDVPPAQIISISKYATIDVLIHAELDRKESFLKKQPWLKVMLKDVLSDPFFVLIVFGSYAKGTQTAKSDLDLLAIVDKKGKIREIQDKLSKAYTKVRKQIQVLTISDFKEMIRNTDELNVGTQAKKYHIILHGAEIYYSILR